MNYAFHPEALTEYSEAVKYYADSDLNLAQAFINTIENAIFRIRESPDRYPKIEDDIRRCLTKKFPYALLYTVNQESILILAIMHCNRQPGYWKSRSKY